jgi:hypothetical protein
MKNLFLSVFRYEKNLSMFFKIIENYNGKFRLSERLLNAGLIHYFFGHPFCIEFGRCKNYILSVIN